MKRAAILAAALAVAGCATDEPFQYRNSGALIGAARHDGQGQGQYRGAGKLLGREVTRKPSAHGALLIEEGGFIPSDE